MRTRVRYNSMPRPEMQMAIGRESLYCSWVPQGGDQIVLEWALDGRGAMQDIQDSHRKRAGNQLGAGHRKRLQIDP